MKLDLNLLSRKPRFFERLQTVYFVNRFRCSTVSWFWPISAAKYNQVLTTARIEVTVMLCFAEKKQILSFKPEWTCTLGTIHIFLMH